MWGVFIARNIPGSSYDLQGIFWTEKGARQTAELVKQDMVQCGDATTGQRVRSWTPLASTDRFFVSDAGHTLRISKVPVGRIRNRKSDYDAPEINKELYQVVNSIWINQTEVRRGREHVGRDFMASP